MTVLLTTPPGAAIGRGVAPPVLEELLEDGIRLGARAGSPAGCEGAGDVEVPPVVLPPVDEPDDDPLDVDVVVRGTAWAIAKEGSATIQAMPSERSRRVERVMTISPGVLRTSDSDVYRVQVYGHGWLSVNA